MNKRVIWQLIGSGVAMSVAAIAIAGITSLSQQVKNVGIEGGVTSVVGTMRDPRSRFPSDKTHLNILVIGKDYNRDAKGMPYTQNSRSDTLMLFSLDLDNKQARALSIPRDTYVVAPDGKRGKINGAYARGGAPLAMQTVGKLLGVQPDYYVALKSDGVKTVVDALDGVEVETLDQMKYDDNWGQLHIDLPKGHQRIDGEQAIGFTRFRKVNRGEPHSEEEGDERRSARQQQLVRAVAQKAKAKFADPRNWSQADDFLITALDTIQTDMTRDQLLALAMLFRGIKKEEIQTQTLTTTDFRSGGLWYVRPDKDKLKEQAAWLL